MSKVTIILLIICVILTALLVFLYFYGKKIDKQQAETQTQMEAAAQWVNMLIIDKKMLRMKDSGLPSFVIEQTPRRMKIAKLPIVKAKIGPKIMTLMCDREVYDILPLKKEVKIKLSGIYIMGAKAIRGQLEQPKKKKGFLSRFTGR